jgi:methionyl-tRNA formyltransferase
MTVVLLSMFADAILNELGPRAESVITIPKLEDFDVHRVFAQTPFDVLVCFGYNKRLPVADPLFKGVRFVNVHTSILPFGRGSNPNFCAWLNGEPHGITIHEMAPAYDTGDILFQKRIALDATTETLRSSYFLKIATAIEFLVDKWDDLVRGNYERTKQERGAGSLLTQKDLLGYADIIARYSDRPIVELLTAVKHAAGVERAS